MALPNPSPDTTVLITGASSGIGEALAREVASLGHNVALVARRKEKLAALADDLRSTFDVEVDLHPADLSRDRARAKLLRDLSGGREIVGVCNNAGIGAFGHVLSHEVAEEEDRTWVKAGRPFPGMEAQQARPSTTLHANTPAAPESRQGAGTGASEPDQRNGHGDGPRAHRQEAASVEVKHHR